MHSINQYLADALKTARTQKGWSLDKASQATGVSKAMLGQIERGESSPTIATLWKIASGFNISLSNFLAPSLVEEGAVFRSANTLRQQPASDGMLVAMLFPYESRFGFEMYELTLLPGYERISEPHETGVTEHIVVISGDMEVLIDEQWLPLASGEAVRFAADQAHGYRNLTNLPVVFHDVIHYQRSGNN